VVIQSLGSERTIDAGIIERSEQSLNVLQNVPLEVLLKDGTVIHGSIVDYDEEIGVFVHISFGNLALPFPTIEMIQDPSRVVKVKTDDQVIGFSGQWTFTTSDDFGSSVGLTGTADFRLRSVPGLYLGTDVFWYPLKYTGNDEVNYNLGGLNAHLLYKALWLEDVWRVFGVLVPYAKLGGGAAFVQVNDDRASAAVEQQGSLTGLAVGQLGFEWNLPSIFWMRFFFNADLVFQSSGVFFLPGAGIGLYLSI
jgi:hypothetical protein